LHLALSRFDITAVLGSARRVVDRLYVGVVVVGDGEVIGWARLGTLRAFFAV
jgi:hypothetical protein